MSININYYAPSNHLPMNLFKSKSSGVAGSRASVTLSSKIYKSFL